MTLPIALIIFPSRIENKTTKKDGNKMSRTQYVAYAPTTDVVVYKNTHEATKAILKNKERFIRSREVRSGNGMLERVIVTYVAKKYVSTFNKLQGK